MSVSIWGQCSHTTNKTMFHSFSTNAKKRKISLFLNLTWFTLPYSAICETVTFGSIDGKWEEVDGRIVYAIPAQKFSLKKTRRLSRDRRLRENTRLERNSLIYHFVPNFTTTNFRLQPFLWLWVVRAGRSRFAAKMTFTPIFLLISGIRTMILS